MCVAQLERVVILGVNIELFSIKPIRCVDTNFARTCLVLRLWTGSCIGPFALLGFARESRMVTGVFHFNVYPCNYLFRWSVEAPGQK